MLNIVLYIITIMLYYFSWQSPASVKALTLWSHCWGDGLYRSPGRSAGRPSLYLPRQSCAPQCPDSAALCGKGVRWCRPPASRPGRWWWYADGLYREGKNRWTVIKYANSKHIFVDLLKKHTHAHVKVMKWTQTSLSVSLHYASVTFVALAPLSHLKLYSDI